MTDILSGQQTVTTAGVAIALGTGIFNKPILVKAHPTNSGYVYIGNNGSDTVSSTNGFVLAAGDSVIFADVGDLSNIYINASANNEKVSWTVLNV